LGVSFELHYRTILPPGIIALARRIDAKLIVLTVLPPFHTFTTDARMLEDTPAQHKARMQKHAERTLGTVTRAAHAAGRPLRGASHLQVIVDAVMLPA
jgi:nucleotide-binding universal stress UspA family protein